MRLIGGKDYYDSGLAFGQDDSVLFVRTGDERMSDQEMHALLGLPRVSFAGRLVDAAQAQDPGMRRQSRDMFRDEVNHSVEVRRDGRAIRHDVSLAQVILCGTVRTGMFVKAYEPYGFRTEVDERWIWTREGLDAYAAQHGLAVREGIEREDAHALVRFERVGTSRWFEPRRLRGAALDAVVERRIVVASRAPADRFRSEDGTPRPWRINQGSLGEIGFAKAVGPYEAFQEISMWVGGVLPADGPRTVQIVDDVVKLQKHGFDHPTSFRRGKAKPRT
jgi:hypothetical protein